MSKSSIRASKHEVNREFRREVKIAIKKGYDLPVRESSNSSKHN